MSVERKDLLAASATSQRNVFLYKPRMMVTRDVHDVAIVGGSFAGLSAAMTLGRSLRKVAVIDSGRPCNAQTPHSHNFITQDGERPAAIAEIARRQVEKYPSVELINGFAIAARRNENAWEVDVKGKGTFRARKLLFATGVKDLMPPTPGFSDCWGISILHCPYCHGYEVSHKPLALLANGDTGFELARLISNWSKDLRLLTDGKASFSEEQLHLLQKHRIGIIETTVAKFQHRAGKLESILLDDGSAEKVEAAFARIPFEQHCTLPEDLGCQLNQHGYVAIDEMQQTRVPGIFAAGDNTTGFRSVAQAAAAGNKAGAIINMMLIQEDF